MIRRWTLGVALVLVAACGGGGAESAATTGTATGDSPVATVAVSAAANSVGVGQTLQMSVTLTSAAGAVVTGRTITWASAVPSVASVSPSGQVAGLSTGTTTISATSEGKTGSISLTVTQLAVQSITVTGATTAVVAGGTLQLSAAVIGANGLPLTGQTIIWTSSDPTKATVSASGLVTGLGSAAAPHVTSVTPSTITAGANVTIAGSGFSTLTGGTSVIVAGSPLLVTAATATQITASVAPTFPCLSSGATTLAVANTIASVNITASLAGQSGTTTLTIGSTPANTSATLQIAAQHALTVGQALLISDPTQVGCNELTGTGTHYLVDVYNVTESETAFSSFELRGATGPLSTNLVAASAQRVIPRTLMPARRLTALAPMVRGPDHRQRRGLAPHARRARRSPGAHDENRPTAHAAHEGAAATGRSRRWSERQRGCRHCVAHGDSADGGRHGHAQGRHHRLPTRTIRG